MEAIKKGLQSGRKRARIKKVIHMLEKAKTEDDKKKVAQYMNKTGVTVDDVRSSY